jgi:hypothetical protein
MNDEKIALPRLPGGAGSPDMPEWQREICGAGGS